jgi:predicted AAA+ superfamily ATPase
MTPQDLNELRERIATLERAGLKASAEALRKELPRERVIVGARRTGKTALLRGVDAKPAP